MGKFIITEEEKNSIRNMYLTEQVGPNAGEIQKFLQTNQDNTIVVDYKFGPKTATAVAKYILKAYPSSTKYSNVTTVQQLWQALKDNGNDVGENELPSDAIDENPLLGVQARVTRPDSDLVLPTDHHSVVENRPGAVNNTLTPSLASS